MRAGSAWLDAVRAGRFALVAGAAWLLCALVRAEDFSSLTNAAALQSLVQRARGGQPDAMLSLANFLVTRGDLTNAAGWYRAGAERGDPQAQLAFAQCLAAGRGVATNLAAANRWSQLAAKAGVSNALVDAKRTTNASVPVVAKAAPPSAMIATNAPSTGITALLAVVAPAPLKVAARELATTPPPVTSTIPTNPTAPISATTTAKSPATEPEPPRWRIPPEEVGEGIHFPRATDLPPLAPTVQDEPAVVRPPEIFR